MINYIKDVLGINQEDIKEIKTTFFNLFQDISIVKQYGGDTSR